MTRQYTLFICLLGITLLSACVPVPARMTGEQVSQSFADGLLQEWLDNSARFTSIQGLAKVRVRGPEKSLSGTQVIIAEKSDHLRAETLSPFGSPLLLLAADGDKLGVLLTAQNLYYTGTATPENLRRFIRIPLRLADLVSILLYQPPLINVKSAAAFQLEEGGWMLLCTAPPRRQELIFSPSRQLVEVRYFAQDNLFLKIAYGEFMEERDYFPSVFEIDLPEQQTTASLEFADPSINGELRPDIFQMTPPTGATVITLDDE